MNSYVKSALALNLCVPIILIALMLVACTSSKPNSSIPEYVDTSRTVAGPERLFDWPVTVVKTEAEITFYEPQISSWDNYDHLNAWMAVSINGLDFDSTKFGVIQLQADTAVDFGTRSVNLYNIKVADVSFPELQGDKLRKLVVNVRAKFLDIDQPANLDLMLASMADNELAKTTEVNVKPPAIYYRAQPAVLLLIDGNPLISPIKDNESISFVVNTNWDLYQEKSTGDYYLLHKDRWLRAPNLDSPFVATDTVPKGLGALPDNGNWKQTRASLPAKPWGSSTPPDVLVSLKPAELIVTASKPQLEKIPATEISYVTNTTSDLFRHGKSWYYLVAGRWFGAKDLQGPWQYATSSLPEYFSMIPDNHEKSHVLSSVPGTIEAQFAVIQSQIPVKAAIKKTARVEVEYAGDPKFERITGTSLEYAANSRYDIVKYKTDYFVCYQGVWFLGPSPTGPFRVATVIPSEIYNIPPNHPLYHVTFVTIYDSDEKTVTTGYTSGYHHHYIYGGTVVWGTGWYYPPYYYYYGDYPYYYYYPYTYGISAGYNPATGTYSRRAEVYGPYGGYGRASAYNPKTGTYARANYVWDSNEGYGIGGAYNPRTGTSLVTEQGYNDYKRWGETVITRGDEWATISKTGDQRGTRRDIETSKGGKGTIVTGEEGRAGIGRSGEGDIYAGKDGNVYKRDENGWHKREDGDWSQLDQGRIDSGKDSIK